MTLEDGTPLVSYEDLVAPVNLLGAVMWEHVEIHLNDQPFSVASAANAGLKAYLDCLLSYDFDARHTHLHTQLMEPDTPGQENTHSVANAVLRDFMRRRLIDLREAALAGPGLGVNQVGLIPADLGFTAAERAALGLVLNRELDVDDDETVAQRLARERRWKEEEDAADTAMNRLLAASYGARAVETTAGSRNLGFEARARLVAFSNLFTLYAPLPHDFFNMDKVIGPGNKIDIKLERYPDAFLLNSYLPKNYKLELVDMKLHLHAFRRSESIPKPMVEKYRMNETTLYKHVVAQGMPRTSFRIVHGGVLPKTVVVAMNYTTAIEGNYGENPFNFTNMGLRRIALIINGEEFPAAGGLSFDFGQPNPNVARGYHWLYDHTGAWFSQRGNCITYDAFKNGSFLVPFDLTPDRCNGMHEHLAHTGQIDLELEFSRRLPAPVTVCYELTYPKVVVNNKSRGTVHTVDVDK